MNSIDEQRPGFCLDRRVGTRKQALHIFELVKPWQSMFIDEAHQVLNASIKGALSCRIKSKVIATFPGSCRARG